MKTLPFHLLVCSALSMVIAPSVFTQSGGEQRRFAIMRANQVRTVFGNWGVIGQPAEQGYRGAWRNDRDGYIGDVSILVGAEIDWQGKTFHSVATCPVDRPTAITDTDPISGKFWTFEPVGGYFNANQDRVATSDRIDSWPQTWPDKMQDPTDPGWKGSWNGYFGKKISADQETYFIMDDNNDERFNFSKNNTLGVSFKPDSTNSSRNGMGLVVNVRALQWAQFLAKDNIFWLYDVNNTSTTTYNKVVFGMLVGTYVGVTSTEDYREYSDDWSFYSPTLNLTYTGDIKAIKNQPMSNPNWVGGCGLVGYAFLESPGNPFDGIDNDGDADSSTIGRSAPLFTAADFDSVLITPGMNLVLINDDFSRQVFPVPNADSIQVHTRGLTTWIYPGRTKVVEGNVLTDARGNPYVNPNAYDGVDNNFNGLIDENYRLHVRQTKINPKDPLHPIFDIPRPVRHANYVSGLGTSAYSMIDESRDDLIDNNLDWNVFYDDVGRDGISDTHDFGEGDGNPTSGYNANKFDTGLPGEPHIDKTDVRESDQIGLTSFNYFTPANNFRLGDDESLWNQLVPGLFDVPTSIVEGVPQGGEDGDFIYGSGYFPLLGKTTERFSLALVYGGGIGGGLDADLEDLKKNKGTVQDIYNANYQFPQPPDKPTLTAVPGDHEVTLYWDRKAESSIDPVLRTRTFEGYKIYKSTDPDFSDIFTITDGSGAPQGYKPLQQFDLVDSTTGYFQATGNFYQGAYGFTFYLGSDNGLQHSYVDKNVDNGRRYYYALVSYSRGDAVRGIFPAENTKLVSILPSGEITHDVNVAVVVPNGKTAGYVPPPDGVFLNHVARYGTGSISYQVLDPSKLKTHKYRVGFFDTEVDSLGAAGNPIHSPDSTKWTRVTTDYSVLDLTNIVEPFVSLDTVFTTLAHRNIISSSVSVSDQHGVVIDPARYLLRAELGTIRGSSAGSLPTGNYTITYQYYPVFRSPNIQLNPALTDSKDADVFDGLQLAFQNSWKTVLDTSKSKWTKTQAYTYTLSPLSVEISGLKFQGYAKPSDYAIVFSDSYVDSSYADPDLYPFSVPVKFRIYDQTDSTYAKFIFADNDANGVLSALDEIVLVERNPDGKIGYTWDLTFSRRGKVDSLYQLRTGDTLLVRTLKPFRYGDTFEFTPVLPMVDEAKEHTEFSQVRKVRVVPNPYVTASQFELPLPPGVTSGRGTRKIDFIHVPAHATIKIFTVRGDYVTTLRQDGNIEDGTVSWNLRTYENLDIAYGIYFYVVESPVGNTTGKIAIIK